MPDSILPRLLLSLALLQANIAGASDMGVVIGWSNWSQEYTGIVKSEEDEFDLDLGDDLGLKNNDNSIAYITFEHFIPAVPNIKVQYSSLFLEEDATLERGIDFGGETFAVDANVQTEFDMSHTDLTLYWQPLQAKLLTLGFGITVRFFDNGIIVKSRDDEELRAEEAIDNVLPMLYGKARFDIPKIDVAIIGEVNGSGYDGSTLIDSEIRAVYTSPFFGLGIEVGYRSFDLELDDIDGLDADLDVSGIHYGITYRWLLD